MILTFPQYITDFVNHLNRMELTSAPVGLFTSATEAMLQGQMTGTEVQNAISFYDPALPGIYLPLLIPSCIKASFPCEEYTLEQHCTFYTLSILAHEYIHHVQWAEGRYEEMTPEAREEEAWLSSQAITEEYLNMYFGPNPERVHAIDCREEDTALESESK